MMSESFEQRRFDAEEKWIASLSSVKSDLKLSPYEPDDIQFSFISEKNGGMVRMKENIEQRRFEVEGKWIASPPSGVMSLSKDNFFPLIPQHRIDEEKAQITAFTSNKPESTVFPYNTNHIQLSFSSENPVYPDSISKGKCYQIKCGLSLDVVTLLSDHGKELHRYRYGKPTGESVDAKSLRDKYIMVCCVFVPFLWCDLDGRSLWPLSLASHELLCHDDFELVLVLKMRDGWCGAKDAFDQFMSGFSGLAVPYIESLNRDYLCHSLGFDGALTLLIVDRDNKVYQVDKTLFYDVGGADHDIFPFTPDQIERCTDYPEEGIVSSLEEILGSSSSYKLYNSQNHRKKMCVSELKDKLVGLYCCYSGQGVPVLVKTSQECKARGLEFEILLVYMTPYTDVPLKLYRKIFNRALKDCNLSCWVLPFKNTICRGIQRKFDISYDKLLIIQPGCRALESYGLEVMRDFGVDAYPFTREAVIKKEIQRRMELKLKSLLPRSYVCRMDRFKFSERVPIAEFEGKLIFVYLCKLKKMELYDMLVKWYRGIKKRYPDFEVVLASVDEEVSKFQKQQLADKLWLSDMPWLLSPVCTVNSSYLASVLKNFYPEGSLEETLVAFGKDGRVCSMFAQGPLEYRGPHCFSFSSDMHNQVLDDFRYFGGREYMYD